MSKKTIAQERAEAPLDKKKMRIVNIRKAGNLKDKGMSNVAIGQELGVHESTVRRMLAKDAEFRALTDKMTHILEEARDEILSQFVDSPEFKAIYGEKFAETFILRISTKKREGTLGARDLVAGFKLDFTASPKRP